MRYAQLDGDWMPDEQEVIVPRQTRKEVCDEEYELLNRDSELLASRSYFCPVLKDCPELGFIRRAQQLLNFQVVVIVEGDISGWGVRATYPRSEAQPHLTRRCRASCTFRPTTRRAIRIGPSSVFWRCSYSMAIPTMYISLSCWWVTLTKILISSFQVVCARRARSLTLLHPLL
jgi:hypothetical protein